MAQFIGKLNGAMVLASIVCQDENARRANETFVKHVRYMNVPHWSPFVSEDTREACHKFWDLDPDWDD